MADGLHVQGTAFVAVPKWVLDLCTPAQLKLYTVLLSFGSPGDTAVWPSQELLAARLDVTSRSIRTVLEELKAKGLVHVEHRYSTAEGPRSNLYHLAWDKPFEVEEPGAVVPPLKVVEMDEGPARKPHRDLGLSDLVVGLLAKLEDVDPKWSTLSADPSQNQAGYKLLRKLVNEKGLPTVTTALQYALEQRTHVQGDTAYPLLRAICKSIEEHADA